MISRMLPVIGLKWLGELGFKNKCFSFTVPVSAHRCRAVMLAHRIFQGILLPYLRSYA